MTSSRRGLLSLLLFVLWIKGGTDGSDVSQTSMLWINEGQDATMNCSHTKGGSYFQMYWYRQLPGKTMELIVFTSTAQRNGEHDFGAFSKEKFSATKTEAERGTFTVKEVQPEDKGLYFCAVSRTGGDANEAYFGRGTKLTVLDPDIKVTPPTVRVFEPSENEHKNQQKTLVCVASDFYPDHVSVSWTINGESITEGVATDGDAVRNSNKEPYRITSRLTVPSNTWFSKSKFTCTVSFFDGTKTTDHPETITSKEKAIPSGTELSRDKYLWITQSAKLSYIIFIAKSCVYGAFIWFVAWKLQSSREKRGK